MNVWCRNAATGGIAALLFSALLAAVPLAADENQWFIRPEDSPRIKGAARRGSSGATVESFLEPPVMPMRQSERKRPPAPDNLIAKAIWGKEATFTSSSGRKLPIADWNLVTVDAERFVEEARAIGTVFDWGNVNLAEFSFDPRKTPSLLFSGVRELSLHESELIKLRQYVMRGGTIICDSVYGSPYFYDSVKKMCALAFPERRFRIIPPDYPLFHIFHKIDHVVLPESPDETRPFLEGIFVGSRIGVLLSKYGLGTGWHGNQAIMQELKTRGLAPGYYDALSARRIGVNIAGFIVGYTDAAAAEAAPELFGKFDLARPTDEFVFAQIRHDGAWDVHPGAASSLLNRLRRETSIRLGVNRVAVDPASDNLAPYPFLYMTGLDDFSFPDDAVSALRSFIDGGGTILVNNGLGLSTFHHAATREIARLIPGAELRPLPPEHEIFQCLFKAIPARYTDSLLSIRPDLGSTPLLLGAEVSGELRVIYSPYDIEAGWLNTFYPLLRGYKNESAQQLGMNIIAYAITH